MTKELNDTLDMFTDPVYGTHKTYGEAVMQAVVDDLNAMESKAEGLIKPKKLMNPNNKWFVRSALQKAVRRGELDRAIRCASYLIAEDVNYFWYSMQIIAIEDIGVTDPDAVFFTTALSGSAVVRKKVNHVKIAELLLKSMCSGAKTRACCEISIAAGYFHQDMKKKMYTLPEESLIEIATKTTYNDLKDLYEIYYALMIVRGHGSPPDGMDKRPKSPEGMYKIMEHMLRVMPYEQARASMLAFEKVKDNMNLAYYPLWLVSVKESMMPVNDDLPPEIEIKSLSGSALDMHTSVGKKAIKAFYTSLKKDYPEIAQIDEEKAVRALGAVVFVEEGGLETMRVMSPMLQEVKDAQDYSFITCSGVSKANYTKVREIVRSEIDRLNEKRKWASKLKY